METAWASAVESAQELASAVESAQELAAPQSAALALADLLLAADVGMLLLFGKSK
jgi:hypothetical protein